MLKLISLVIALKSVHISALRPLSQTLKPFLGSKVALYNTMTHGVKKENLPSKMCVTCNRPFTWRKKWERCWDEVTTCSKGCNAKRRASAKKDGSSIPGDLNEDEEESDEDDADKPSHSRGKSVSKVDSRSASAASSSKARLTEPAENSNDCDDIDADTVHGDSNDSITPDKKSSRKKLQKLKMKEMEGETIESIAKSAECSSRVKITKLVENSNDSDDSDDAGAETNNEDSSDSPVPEKRLSRKKLQKLKMKEMEGESSNKEGPQEKTKPCAVCKQNVILSFRCQWDASKQWRFVCEYINKSFGVSCDAQSFNSTDLPINRLLPNFII